jgi:hypothetical protein
MGSLEGVKPGDELVITSVHRKMSPSDEPRTVKVHKVGRTLVHILRSEDKPERGTDTYRIENGIANDNYGHSELWKRQDWEAEKRRDALEEALGSHGVEAWRRGPKPIAVLEALLDVMERYKRGEIK